LSENIELKARVVRRLFYGNDFGVYALEPITKKEVIKVHEKYETFVMNGQMPELYPDMEYDLIITPSTHHKYGDGYSFVGLKPKPLVSNNDQQVYLKTMLKESQYNVIIKKYPDHPILDMMRDGTFDYSDIHGIGDKVYAKIKKFLLDNIEIQEAITELQDLNITFKAMKKLINHFGSASVVVSKVKENIYILCDAEGFGFQKVDAYALSRGDSKENPNRIIAAIEYLVEQAEQQGHSWVHKGELIEKTQDLLQIDTEYIEDRLTEEESNPKTNFYIKGQRVALFRNYYYEKQIKSNLMRLLNAENKFTVKDIEQRIDEYEELKGITFTHEQRNAIILAAKYNVLIINGKAGTGKTFTLQGVLAILNGLQYVCCALSGKASKIMSGIGLNAMTLHRMLGVSGEGGFKYNFNNKLPHGIVVMDESGMNSNYIMYSVITAIKDGTKFIMLGDTGQLASIGAGSVFDDIIRSGKVPMQELTIIQRQGLLSGILSTANKVREGEQIVERYDYEKKVFGELKDMVVFPLENKTYIKDMVVNICQNYKGKDINEFQVITGLRDRGDISVKTLNIELQKVFNDMNKPFVKRGAYEYREDDKIIQCGNNYDAKTSIYDYEKREVDFDDEEDENRKLCVFNGTLGRIVEITKHKEKNYIYIKFDGIEQLVCYSQDLLDQIELAYAISVHKSQGSTIQHVLFVFDFSSYMLLSKQFVYTGITRASKACVIICENKALQHAIRTDHSGLRQTFLYDLLMEDEADE
jgi:exodeoxyribonuclease V alpha subunit